MSYSTLFRILYMGRNGKIFDELQTIFAEQNQIATKHSSASSRNGVSSFPIAVESDKGKAGGKVDERALPWPIVESVMATNQKTALQLIRAQPPAIVLVELEQKSTSRLRFCDVVRYRLPTATILAVTSTIPDGTFLFDDVLDLPLRQIQVVSIIKQSGAKHTEHLLELGSVALNMATRTVTTPNGRYTMTPKQCALLKLLMSEHGTVVERKKIMETVWETNYLEDTRTLDVHIRWLRERIEHNPSKPVYLRTVRGVGYQFEAE